MYTEEDLNLVRSMIGNYDTAINSLNRSHRSKAETLDYLRRRHLDKGICNLISSELRFKNIKSTGFGWYTSGHTVTAVHQLLFTLGKKYSKELDHTILAELLPDPDITYLAMSNSISNTGYYCITPQLLLASSYSIKDVIINALIPRLELLYKMHHYMCATIVFKTALKEYKKFLKVIESDKSLRDIREYAEGHYLQHGICFYYVREFESISRSTAGIIIDQMIDSELYKGNKNFWLCAHPATIWRYPNNKTRSKLAIATKTRIDFLNDLIKNIKSYI